MQYIPSHFLAPATESARIKMHESILNISPSVEYFRIGKSISGRELLAYKIGNGRGRVAFFAAHHALESITANLLYSVIYLALSGRAPVGNGNSLSHLLSLYTYYFVPCVNPDGIELRLTLSSDSPIAYRFCHLYESFPRWQANERGVDLNHNYDYGFYEYKSIERERKISAGATLYSGEYPESEPESRAAASFVRALAPVAVVSLHSQGEEIFFFPSTADRAAASLAKMTGYKLSYPTDTAAYGGLCDYTGGILSIPSFTLEVGRGKNPLDESQLPSLIAKLTPPLLLLPTLL